MYRLQDKFLKFKFDASTVEAGKAFAKAELQREAGLPVDPSAPVFGFIGEQGASAVRCSAMPLQQQGRQQGRLAGAEWAAPDLVCQQPVRRLLASHNPSHSGF